MGEALLVSGGLGMGHEVTAQTCAASLRARGWSTRTVDAMRLLGRRGGVIGETVFRCMFAVPGLYDAFHFAALRPGGKPALWADAAARRRLVPQLRRLLDTHPTDLVISVFSTGVSAVSELVADHPGIRHIVFCTDATPHRLWVHPNVDLYLVTSRVAECAVRRFQPRARVIVMPPPVRAAFYTPPTRRQARAHLGVPDQARCVLLMSGGWGLGPVAEAASALADAGLHVLAVAGRNARLAATLRQVQRRNPLVHAFGFTDRIPELMAAADLVITSSGDTCTEARTVGRPLLLLDVVPGHGRDNLQHELELGGASVTSPERDAVVAHALAALGELADGALGGGAARLRGASPERAATPCAGPPATIDLQQRIDGTRDTDVAGHADAPGGETRDGGRADAPASAQQRWEAAFSAALAAVGLDQPSRKPATDRLPADGAPIRESR